MSVDIHARQAIYEAAQSKGKERESIHAKAAAACRPRQMSRRKRLLHLSGDLIYQVGQLDRRVGALPAFEGWRDHHGFRMILKPDEESGFIGAG